MRHTPGQALKDHELVSLLRAVRGSVKLLRGGAAWSSLSYLFALQAEAAFRGIEV